MNKTLKILKNASIVLIGSLSLIFSLIKYFLSVEKYQDEYGLDLSFNNDYVIAILVSLFILVIGLIYLVKAIKEQEVSKYYGTICGLSCSALVSFYSLGYLFKQLNKDKLFNDNLNYFFIGLVALAILVYFIFDLIIKNKENKVA